MSKTHDSGFKKVIDVSYHNGIIDWEKVAAQGMGAIIRCGYGDDHAHQDDQQFERNVRECIRLGIPFGIYLYSYAQNQSQLSSEIQHAIRCFNNISDWGGKLSYPVFYDLEEWWKNGSATWQRENAGYMAELFTINLNALGIPTGVYASLEAWENTTLRNYMGGWRWIAAWRNTLAYDCELWQYTNDGSVAGVPSRVDMNNLYSSAVSEPAKPEQPNAPSADRIDTLAREVIAGKWGNGWTRRTALGGDYAAVQSRVNQYYDMATRVIRGEFGNQPNRQVNVEGAGFDYPTVQRIVNDQLK